MSLFRAGASIVITYYAPMLMGHTPWPEDEEKAKTESKDVAESEGEQSSTNDFVKVSDLNGHA